MTASMAVVDYIPVFFFLVSSVILQRDLYNKMSKGAFAVFCAGTMMVFFAGFFKATWKLLYALNVCDFFKLNYCMMPMQSTGFFLAAAALIAMLFFRQGDTRTYAFAAAAVPAAYTGTGIFIAMMCSGVGVISFSLSVLAVRLKKKWLIAVFVFTFVAMLVMGYLSSKDFEEPLLNWMAEVVNVLGQGALLFGAITMHKAGLADLELKN